MGKSTIIGLLVGFGAVILSFIVEKGNILSLLLVSPAIIVFGGTFGALLISFSLSDFLSIPKFIKDAATNPPVSLSAMLEELLGYATMVKREGLLSLEKIINDETFKKEHDQLLQRGLMLLMDGLDREALKSVLESDVYVFEQAKKREISIFEAAGGFSPTMGIIGTVMGLVQVLSNMSSPEELAKSISVAFIATLYGVCFANLMWLPIANKLKLRLKTMSMEKEMIIEGLLSINDLENPMVIREKLVPFVSFQTEKSSKTAEKEDARGEIKVEQAS
jgi:chemotaxis protein MotA